MEEGGNLMEVRTFIKSEKRIFRWKSTVAFLLCWLFVLEAAARPFLALAADDDSESVGTTYVKQEECLDYTTNRYKWRLCNSREDIEKYTDGKYSVKALLMWKSENSWYYLAGGSQSGKKLYGTSISTNSTMWGAVEKGYCYTYGKKEPTDVIIYNRTKAEGSHSDCYSFNIDVGGHRVVWYKTNCDLHLDDDSSYQDRKWVFEHLGNGYTGIFGDIANLRDTAFSPEENYLYGVAGNGEEGIYLFFLEETVVINCFRQDLSITKGSGLSIHGNKSEVAALSQCTITVNKGGLLSVSDTLLLNGKIINEGTVIVNEGGCISNYLPDSIDPDISASSCGSTSYGNIICQNGGTLIVLSGGKIYMNKNATGGGLTIKSGGGCLNFGTIVVDSQIRVENSTFFNRASGVLLLGYGPSNNWYALNFPNLSVTKSGSLASMEGFTSTNTYQNALFAYEYYIYQPYTNAGDWGMTLTGGGELVNEGIIMQNSVLSDSGGTLASVENGTLTKGPMERYREGYVTPNGRNEAQADYNLYMECFR